MTSAQDEDRALVARILRRKDERAFTALYDRHTAYLYRFALRLTGGDEPAAEDLVHDAWVRAVPRLAVFRWNASLRSWLAGFVVNLAREQVRSRAMEVLPDRRDNGDDDAWRSAANRIDIERALARLAPGYREILVLHDIEGYTHEAIAALLEIEIGTSKSQLSRARAAMRRAIGEPSQYTRP